MNDSPREMGVPGLVVDAWRARRGGAAALRSRQRRRLAELVAFARARSPYFAERLSRLPEVVSDPTRIPVTSKPELMSRFDDWVTDREVTRQQVEDLVADPARIGEPLLGRYAVATTSGTTGVRGIFVMDPGSLAVAAALSTRMLAEWLDPRDVWRILRRLRVQGRSGEAVRFASHEGFVTIAPLAFSSALGSVGGIERFQVVQRDASGLRLRLLVSPMADIEEVWRRAGAAVQALLAGHGVRDAIVERAEELPERTAGGKYREVIPFAQ